MNKYLDIYWQAPDNHERFKIGTLSFEEPFYYFSYCNIDEACRRGFQEIYPFFDKTKVYASVKMFSSFLSRLPDEKQIGIEGILKRYDLKEYDAFELLARSNGRIPGDTLEFIAPISGNNFDFYIAGVKYGDFCCSKPNHVDIHIPVGSVLNYRREPENQYDGDAVVLYYESHKLGYVPKYYSKCVSDIIDSGADIEFKVTENNIQSCDKLTQECRLCVSVHGIVNSK